MAITSCPTCGKDVDTLRARAVSVRDGRVIAFCSQECKAAAETRPVAAPVAAAVEAAKAEPKPEPAPAKPEPAKAEPAKPPPERRSEPKLAKKAKDDKSKRTDESVVMEITHEPASGVVTSAPDRRDVDAKVVSTPSASAAGSTTIPEDKKKAKKTRPDPPADEALAPEIKVQDKKTPKASDGKSTPIAGFKLHEFKDYKPSDDETPTPPPKIDGDLDGDGDGDGDDHDDHDDHDDAAEADVAHGAGDDAPPARRSGGGGGRRAAIVLVLLLVAGGGAVLVYKLMYANRSNAATRTELPPPPPQMSAMSPAPPQAEAPPPAPSKAPSSADAIAAAKSELTTDLAATPKVAVVAAAALARTGDKAALATLTKLLPTQDSDIGKLVVAYELARGGDAHGRELLAADLRVEGRERRLEASRALARLRDPRAAESLLNYIDYAQFRMSIAVLLAEEMKDAKAVKALDDIVADPKTTVDDKVRATIALAVAGRPKLTDKLHGFLADDHFNNQAAAALARLHDEAARPVLENQLAVSSLRVNAARALRTLDPARDLSALLPPLVAALSNVKDTERIGAAETILILAGDAAWSAYE